MESCYVYNNFSELCYYLKKFQDISYDEYMRLSTNALMFAKKEFDFNDYVDFLLNEYTLIKGGK